MISLVIGMTKCFILSGMSRISLHALRHTGAELALVASHGLVCPSRALSPLVASHGLVCPSRALSPNEAQDSLGAEQGLADALKFDLTEGSGNAAGR